MKRAAELEMSCMSDLALLVCQFKAGKRLAVDNRLLRNRAGTARDADEEAIL